MFQLAITWHFEYKAIEMIMKKIYLFPLLIMAICHSAVLAQKAVPAAVRTIDTYCKGVDAIKKKRRSPDLIYADVSDYTVKEEEEWRKFSSEKALDKFRETTETYSIAYNWQNAGRIVASTFTLSSPSGDWVEYVHHYFRPKGSLARVEVELRTFNGDYLINQVFYFDDKGKQVHKTVRYRDLQTKKPKKAVPEMIAPGALFGPKNYYMNTSELPFTSKKK